MKISLITDEIRADPETAIELRGFGTDRVPNLSAFQKQRIVGLLEGLK